MRRRLIVMRHAKSSWNDESLDDHGRPLNKRGRRDAPLIARRLVQLGWTPEVVYSSNAARTRETIERMLPEFDSTPSVSFRPAMYHGGVHQLREAVADASAEVGRVLALGHNPGWQLAVTWLSGEHAPLTTGNAALLETASDTWREALHDQGHWQLVDVLRPKELIAE